MSFADVFPDLMQRPTPLMRRFRSMLDEDTGGPLEALARQSQQATRRQEVAPVPGTHRAAGQRGPGSDGRRPDLE